MPPGLRENNKSVKREPSRGHRMMISVRPKTAKPATAFLDPGDAASTKLRRIRRCSSVEESQNDTPNTPLVTRKISLERTTPLKVPPMKFPPEDMIGAESEAISKVPPQRVVKIDLRELKWEEAATETDDEGCTCHLAKTDSAVDEARPIRRKRAPKDDETPTTTPSSADPGKPQVETQAPAQEGTENVPPPPYWTTGKTTSERRAKFQKTFSIHPSFNKFSVEGEDSTDGAESEGHQYPESMTRTSRRSLHVALQEDVETMISSSKKPPVRSKSLEETLNSQATKTATVAAVLSNFQKQPKAPHSVYSTPQALPGKELGQAKVKPDPMPNQSRLNKDHARPEPVLEETKVNGKLSASEKRKMFGQRCSSLPSAPGKVESPNRNGGPLKPPLIRQSSSPTTKLAIKSKSEKSFGKSRTGGLNNNNERFVRPKTAPIHPTTTTSRENPAMRTRNGRRPPFLMRAPGQITVGKEEPGTKDVPANSGANNTNKGKMGKQVRQEPTARKVEENQESESSPPPPPSMAAPPLAGTGASVTTPPGNRFSPKIGSRRSFSLDEASLLNYSTSIPDSIESVENTFQSNKRREECLKIYDKMKRGGCVVRLHTIFRGLMTPSEYRTFIAAAEKATPSPEVGNYENDDGGGGGGGEIQENNMEVTTETKLPDKN